MIIQKLNWAVGLRRISVLFWVVVSLLAITGFSIELERAYGSDDWYLWALMYVPAVGCPIILHKLTCWVAGWLKDGFNQGTQ